MEALSRQIGPQPANPELLLRRGELYRISSQWDEALADFDRAAQLDPANRTIDFRRGRLLAEARRYDDARMALDRFLEINPDDAEGLIVRARLFREMGRPLEGGQDYTAAIALTSDPTPALYLERAETLTEAGPAYWDAAVQSVDEGIDRFGPLVSLVSFAIDLDLNRQQYDRALSRIDRLLAEAPRREKWLTRQGEILEQAGRPDESRAAYEEALSALKALPSRLRQVPASRELEGYLRALLARDLATIK